MGKVKRLVKSIFPNNEIFLATSVILETMVQSLYVVGRNGSDPFSNVILTVGSMANLRVGPSADMGTSPGYSQYTEMLCALMYLFG